MNSKLQKATTAVIVATVVACIVYACTCPPPPPEQALLFPGVVACPNHSSFDTWKGTPDSMTPAGPTTSVALAGETTLIPEFHDCQRLISARNRFVTLAAIWVPGYLAVVGDSAAHGRAIPAAVIHAWDGSYPLLGIRQGWNCLFLRATEGGRQYSAVMVPVASDSACVGSVAVDSLTAGTPLDVTTSTNPELELDDYPPVGRWDRERDGRSNFIGLSCGAAWCEVHTAGTAHPGSPSYRREPAAPRRAKRVFAMKGWYDEQQLEDRSTGILAPTAGLATLVPDPQIERLSVADYTSGVWQTVSYSSIAKPVTSYFDKLRLGDVPLPSGTPPGALTETALCREGVNPNTGRLATCPGIPAALGATCDWQSLPENHPERGWFARISTPKSNEEPLYKCVTRHDHSEFGRVVPATARWKWLQQDETQWTRCDQGCCTVK